MELVQTKELVRYLKSSSGGSLGTLHRLKHIYRPRICPLDTVLNLLPENQSVLDIGCGTGAMLQLVAQYRKPVALAGIETISSLIDMSRSIMTDRLPAQSIRLETYDGHTLPSWIRDYTYVLFVDVLHHIPPSRHISFLENLFRGMRSGSTLILKDINGDRRVLSLFNKAHDLLLARQYVHEIGITRLESILREVGYEITQSIEQRVYVYPHFTIVCRKP